MAQQNRISVTITQEIQDGVMKHIADIKALLKPFMHPKGVVPTITLVKMGDKTQPWSQKALDYAKTNKEFSVPTVDAAEWQRDFDAWQDLVPMKNQLAQALGDVDDTIMMLGSESYDPARWYYNLAKQAALRGDLSAKPIADDLSKRFPGIKRKPTAPVV